MTEEEEWNLRTIGPQIQKLVRDQPGISASALDRQLRSDIKSSYAWRMICQVLDDMVEQGDLFVLVGGRSPPGARPARRFFLEPPSEGQRTRRTKPKQGPTVERREADILAAVEDSPGITKNALSRMIGGRRAIVMSIIDHLVDEGQITIKEGPNRSQQIFIMTQDGIDDLL